jgi:penicillin-binding protein A
LNRALRRISIAVLAMFVLLLINVNYLQGFQPASLATKPGNSRAFYAAQNSYERGSIVTSDGVAIAASKPSSSSSDSIKYQRYYPKGPEYAPVTGYDTVYSQTGIEGAENSLLSGNDSALDVRKIVDLITGKTTKGATVTVTVNSKAQAAAYQALESTGKPGAVVAMNPKTGAILALASYPSYDPNLLAVHDTPTLNKVDSQLNAESPSPLLNNASQTTLPPGSTFKIVTSSAWYNQDPARNPTTVIDSPQPLKLPNGNLLNNDSNEQCGNGSGKTAVLFAFAQSCNTPFAGLGIQLGGPTIKSMATAYGLDNPAALDVPGVTVAPSNFTAEQDKSFTAFDAIGQHDTTVTPLQEAMFAATVANNGVLMKPYLIQQVQASDLSVVDQTQPAQLGQPISGTIAGYEKQMMIAVVQQPEGTGNAFNQNNENGLVIAGKTGTAQNGVSAQPDAVFTAFAPADNPKIAVGVMIEGGGYGAAAAAPIAVAVIKAYLATLGIQ